MTDDMSPSNAHRALTAKPTTVAKTAAGFHVGNGDIEVWAPGFMRETLTLLSGPVHAPVHAIRVALVFVDTDGTYKMMVVVKPGDPNAFKYVMQRFACPTQLCPLGLDELGEPVGSWSDLPGTASVAITGLLTPEELMNLYRVYSPVKIEVSRHQVTIRVCTFVGIFDPSTDTDDGRAAKELLDKIMHNDSVQLVPIDAITSDSTNARLQATAFIVARLIKALNHVEPDTNADVPDDDNDDDNDDNDGASEAPKQPPNYTAATTW